MNIKRSFAIVLMAVLLCLPMWAMTESIKYIASIPHYYDADGTVSVDIDDSQMIWLQASSEGKTAWIGLDNSKQTFKNGSRFHVRWLSEKDNKWSDYYGNLDYKSKSIDWMCMLELGVEDPDGDEIPYPTNYIDLYVQLEDHWDISSLQVCHVNPGVDEAFHESVTQKQTPAGTGRFVTFSTDHFSPYCICCNIGEYDSNELPQTGDESSILLWSALACISLFGMAMLARRRKEA